VQKSAEADSAYWSYKTYLDWDYDRSPYDGVDGTISGKYGPSSAHPTGVNHAFLDGHVSSITRDIDVFVYMYQIRRSPLEYYGKGILPAHRRNSKPAK
jgi:prepilin-type processing-associated H-X9-DG protein